ncbi:hypothetical protein GCM10007989_09180 [Devosia pacifica]|uniref:EamA domain-containing protein n=1 Tax=Devosia pacifica TaxID=1335967 RepID=A0A918VR77_9HYPH|nr:DMT family transporter [Devosia pacifica]GHA16308.1 hypothetical protein GCM10007989_09180 [Devosia pacifica]
MRISQATTGILLGLGGVIALCSMDATVKGVGATIPTLQIVTIRYFGAALWLAMFIFATRRAWPQRKNFHRHALRGALFAITATLFFYGATHLPLAVASALGLSAPIYVSLLGVVFLGERLTAGVLIAIALGISGALIIVFAGEPVETLGGSDWMAWAAGIGAPISYAIILVLLKKHSADEHPTSITMAQSIVAGTLTLPLAIAGYVPPSPVAWGQLALIGLLGALGILMIVGGLKRVSASVFSVVDYSSLLWAAALGFVFYAEVPKPEIWLGGALIVAACAMGMRVARAQAGTAG